LEEKVVRFNAQNKFAEALGPAKEALEILETQPGGADAETVGALSNLATVWEGLGDYAKAEPLRQRALELSKKLFAQNDSRVADAFNAAGGLYLIMGDYAKAQPFLEEALKTRRLVGNSADTAETLGNLAVLHTMLGDFTNAEALYRSSQERFESAGASAAPKLAGVLDNFGGLFALRGDYTNAERLYLRALTIREKTAGSSDPSTALVLDNLGCLYEEMGRRKEAQARLSRALSIDEKALGLDHPNTAAVLNDLGECYTANGEFKQAEAGLWSALAIAEENRSLSLLNRVQLSIRTLLAKEGRNDQAIFFGKQAVNRLQRMRQENLKLSRELQNSFLNIHADYYRGLAALLIDQGRLPEAEQVLAMLKEEEYFEFIRGHEGSAAASTTAGMNSTETGWTQACDAIRGRVVALADEKALLEEKRNPTKEEKGHLEELRKMLSAQRGMFVDTMKQVATLVPTEPGVPPRSLSVSRFEGLLKQLGAGNALLYYVVTSNRLYVILTTPNIQLARSNNITEKALNHCIESVLEALRDARVDPRPAAQELYQAVMAPLAEDLRQAHATNLLIAPDGALRYIPFSALHDGSEYMIQNHRLILFSEASELMLTATPTNRWSVAALGSTGKTPELGPLPYVKEELMGIVKAGDPPTGILPGFIRLDEQFNKQELQHDLSEPNPVLHIASHFVFLPGQASNSFLLLGDGSKLTLDNVLLEDLRFDHLDLLTLSACETAIGEVRPGSGGEIEGFATLAHNQGAKAVLATLWPVLDISTSRFMKNFYLLHEGASGARKAEALQQAQLAFLEPPVVTDGHPGDTTNPRGVTVAVPPRAQTGTYQSDPRAPYAHPYYWAPFVLMGNYQ